MIRYLLAAFFLSAVSVAGCSDGDALGTGEAEIGNRMWTLPSGVAAVGRNVRLAYDAAPLWRGPTACSGRLRDGARDLGLFLRDEFPAIDTVGGYACRRNTADTSRMSVHGTGRALDLMISKRRGAADNVNGDPVANYLVQHAQSMGVQLVIWNRTVWRADGSNAAPYRGPHPHDDHVHVELTSEAARRQTPWFVNAADSGREASPSIDAAGDTAVDAGPPPPPLDAGPRDAGASLDAGPKPDDEGTAPEDPGGPAKGYEWEIPESEPAPDDALGPQSRRRGLELEEEESEDRGCAVGSGSAADASTGGAGLAIIAAAFVSRRRRRRAPK